AQGEIDSLMPEFRRLHPARSASENRNLRLVPYKDNVVGDTGRILLLLFGAVGFVLAVACANVASLLLARTAGRKGEMAVRTALGAGRFRLVRQLMTESLVLALGGASVGILLAFRSLPALLVLAPAELPRAKEIALDWRAVAFAAAISVVTSVVLSITPALLATRSDPGSRLKESASRTGQGRISSGTRRLLIIGEVAISMVLLAGAGLLIRSFIKLNSVDLGFESRGLYAMQLSLNSAKYKTTREVWNLERNLIDRLSRVHGVEAAATSSSLPLERGLRDGMDIVAGGEKRHIGVEVRAVSPRYFRTLGITVLRGRAFNDTDIATSQRVLIINQTLARAYGPDSDPMSQMASGNKAQVVGVVSDVKEMGLDQPVRPTLYVPVSQLHDGLTKAVDRWFLTSCLIRARNAAGLKTALSEAVHDVDPTLPVAGIRPMDAVVAASMSNQRFVAFLMTAFAGIALMLSALGIYGVLSYQVKQRTAELGIRLALGATRQEVIRLVVKEGMTLTILGLSLGLIASLAFGRLLSGMLFGLTARDPLTLTVIVVLLAGVALIACAAPAFKASRIDPVAALRYE
ncbi:MAG: FtsX-like permease family protein, partial [Blastocatellia bacterium]